MRELADPFLRSASMSTTDHTDMPAVLVVEDEILIREDAIDVLEQEGFEALRAGSVGEALQVLDQRHDIRAVFTDIQMPGERDGIDLARHLAEWRPEVAVVVTSGRSFSPPADLPSSSRFVPKPYMPRKIARLLRDMIASVSSGWGPGFGGLTGAPGSSSAPAR